MESGGRVLPHQNVPHRFQFGAVGIPRILDSGRHPAQISVLVELQDADELPGAPAVHMPIPQPLQHRLVMGWPLGPPLPDRSGTLKRGHLPPD